MQWSHILLFSLQMHFNIFHHHQPGDTAPGALVLYLSTAEWHSIRTKGWLTISSNWQSEIRASSQRTSSNKKAVTHFPKTNLWVCQHDFCNRVLVNREKIKRSYGNMKGVGSHFAKELTIDKREMALWGWEIICWHNALFILYFYHVSFFSFYLVWCFWLKRNTYMQFLCECMKIDCEIDCDARGLQLRSCLLIYSGLLWGCVVFFTEVSSARIFAQSLYTWFYGGPEGQTTTTKRKTQQH